MVGFSLKIARIFDNFCVHVASACESEVRSNIKLGKLRKVSGMPKIFGVRWQIFWGGVAKKSLAVRWQKFLEGGWQNFLEIRWQKEILWWGCKKIRSCKTIFGAPKFVYT